MTQHKHMSVLSQYGSGAHGVGQLSPLDDWYSVIGDTTNSGCVYGNFLFDLSVDPHERMNLWDSDDHQEVRAELIARAEFLVRDQKNDYGKILYEVDQKAPGACQRRT